MRALDKKMVAFRIPPDINKALERRAKSRGKTKQDIVVQALSRHLSVPLPKD